MPRRPKRPTRRPRKTDKALPDPIAFGRLLKRRRAKGLLIFLVIVIGLILIDRVGGTLPVGDDWHRYHGQSFEVVRVVDGDTLIIRAADGDKPTTRIRLWGVDTPELARNGGERPAEPWADEATAFARQHLEGERVTLELEQHRLRDRYARVLAHVVLPDGEMLNERLILAGLSEHDDRWSHGRAEAYERSEQRARRDKAGLWSD